MPHAFAFGSRVISPFRLIGVSATSSVAVATPPTARVHAGSVRWSAASHASRGPAASEVDVLDAPAPMRASSGSYTTAVLPAAAPADVAALCASFSTAWVHARSSCRHCSVCRFSDSHPKLSHDDAHSHPLTPSTYLSDPTPTRPPRRRPARALAYSRSNLPSTSPSCRRLAASSPSSGYSSMQHDSAVAPTASARFSVECRGFVTWYTKLDELLRADILVRFRLILFDLQ